MVVVPAVVSDASPGSKFLNKFPLNLENIMIDFVQALLRPLLFGLLEIHGVIEFDFMGLVSSLFEFRALIMSCTSQLLGLATCIIFC